MYLNLGQTVLPAGEIVGIFDLDNASWAFKTREFLERSERESRAVWLTGVLPRSYFLPPLSAAALKGRAETGIT